MGDRISFSFRNGDRESIVFFSHWNGKRLLGIVEDFYVELRNFLKDWDRWSVPLSRMEPENIMLNFIRWSMSSKEWCEDNYYLGKDKYDGDNSDNGHWVFNLQTGTWDY